MFPLLAILIAAIMLGWSLGLLLGTIIAGLIYRKG